MIMPNLGFTPRTREKLIHTAYESWKKITGSTDTFTEFQGTNVHRFSNIIYDEVEALESLVLELNTRMFDFWVTNNLHIKGSMGSSFEGWQNRFVDTGLCLGLDIVSSDDPKMKTKWTTEADKLVPGEIVIFFDELIDSDKSYESDLHSAWLQCKNIAEPTKHGDHEIAIHYSNGKIMNYKYYNLKKENYTKFDLKVEIQYEKKGLQYPDSQIKDSIIKKFNSLNSLNKDLFPGSLVCQGEYEGVISIKLQTKIISGSGASADSSYVDGNRAIKIGEKFDINNIELTQKDPD